MRLLLPCLFLFVGFSGFAQNLTGGFTYDGEARTYNVFLPEAYAPGVSLPLVINLHGFGSDAGEQRSYSGMNLVADTAGYLVVYPQGLNRQTSFGGSGNSWNAGFGTEVDDVGFLSELIDRLWTTYDIDLSRVYATGMSNGGYMSYELACSLSDRIAAIASVTGSMTLETFSDCAPERPVPVLQFHGTADLVVPYNGIPPFSRPLEEVIDYWTTHNACPAAADTIEVADSNPNDGSTVTHYVYSDCAAATAVEFYKINGGGHTWPGAFPLPFGSTNQDIRATPLILEFFGRHTHPAPRAGTTLTATREPAGLRPLAITPNPTDGPLQLTLPQDGPMTLEVLATTGRRMYAARHTGASTLLDLSAYPPGIYLLRLRYPNGSYLRRLVRQ